ncbi:ATPase invovled in DNA repair [Halosimplex carlsbadense 2-9-1]|uniref:ATPase invovled in DNA repair n=2 Tax=Halosimplex carlsbadense TaxID=171164 RepID=M0CEP5_9EURY|nr:ATPase invovled in DNA repair [Halosimplex carlsbadense 2-9-1]
MAAADVGESVTVAVELEFSHEGAEYTAKRTAAFRKRTQGDYDGEIIDDDLTVAIRNDGETREPGNPKNTLEKVIPERLSDLFFFDGEDIDELSQFENREHVQEAIQNIMGLTILERATRHLETVAGRFEDEAAETGSDELATLIEDKKEFEQSIEELKTQRTDKQRAKKQVQERIQYCNQQLENLEDTKALQQQRQKNLDSIDDLEQEVADIEDDLRAQINRNGFITVGMPLITDTAEDINRLREQGDLPSRLSNEYLNTLLEAHECICGRPLDHGTEPYGQVASMKGDVSTDGVDQAALRLVGGLEQFSERKEEFSTETAECIANRKEKRDEISNLEERNDDISSELQEMETEAGDGLSIQELESERADKLAEKENLNKEIGQLSEKIEQKQTSLDEIEEEIQQHRDKEEEARLARRRQYAAERVQHDLQDSFDELKDRVRNWSDERVRTTFDQIASKNYSAGINESFSLEIYREDQDGNRVTTDISTGERQIASLAFIGSLVKIAQDRYENDSEYDYFTGGIYPLVMDSPFGALDNEHREEVSRVIPELGSQVIVLATDSQWEGPVAERMSDRIEQQYWLDYQQEGDENGRPLTHIRSEQAAMAGE